MDSRAEAGKAVLKYRTIRDPRIVGYAFRKGTTTVNAPERRDEETQDGCSLEQALRFLPGPGTSRKLKVERIPNGRTNRVYKVEKDGKPCILRISGANTKVLGLNRPFERDVMRAAARLGVGPGVEVANLRKGVFVFEFLPGLHPGFAQMHDPAVLTRVVEALRRVHTIPLRRVRFCPFQKAEEWYQGALRHGVRFPGIYQAVHAQMQKHRKTLESLPALPPRLCHNDAVRPNLLLDDDAVRLVDWEYAALGDPVFDLTVLCMNNGLSPEEEKSLLEQYLGKRDASAILRLRILKLAFDFHLWVWYLAQPTVVTSKGDLEHGIQHHYTRLTRNLQTLP